MNRIKHINIYLSFLLLFAGISFTSCDGDGGEIVNMVYPDRQIKITGISPEEGYVGEPFHINGADFGISKELVKVFIGDVPAEVVSCEDEKIIVLVPEEATTGKISLSILDSKVESEFTYTVKGKPSVTAIQPPFGFVGDEISILGANFGTNKSLVRVLFAGSEEPANIVSCDDDKIVVEIPENAISGKISLQISQQKINMPEEFVLLERAQFLSIEPQKGYRGAKVTLKGTNFGADKEKTQVMFGELAATIVSSTNEEIVVVVPADATLGDNVVSLKTPYEEVENTHLFEVLPTPQFVSVPSSGYMGTEITITGSHFSDNAEEVKVLFDGTEGEIIACSPDALTVKVPMMESEGSEVDLSILMLGSEVYNGVFMIHNSPVVSSVTSNNALNEQLVRGGDLITIEGKQFASSTVKVFIGEKEVSPRMVSDQKIEVIAPDEIASGRVTLQFEGIPAITAGELTVLSDGTDITQYVLKNSRQPFADAEGTRAGKYASPADWIVNEAALNCKKAPGAGLQGEGESALLSVQAGWDFNNMVNGKIYQKTPVLPKGRYEFSLDVKECGSNRGRFAVFFTVMKGDNMIPDIIVDEWELASLDNVLASYRISDNRTAHSKVMDIVDLNEDTPLTVGLVAQLTDQGWVKLSSIKVTWRE